jgi:sugar/nucleoside kinase (ribokinase family)
MDYVTFGIIIDDLERADGVSQSGLLGGGGPQTAFGMRLWSESVGLVARVGADLPEAARHWLRISGVDEQGVAVTAWPTLRALQRVDAGGRRRHEWHAAQPAVTAQLRRSAADVPPGYRAARGWHLGVHPDEPDWEQLAGLRGLGGVLSVETFRPAEQPLPPAALRRLLQAADVFSPNALSAQSLVGPGEPVEMAGRLLAAGAGVLALRLGALGSLVAANSAAEARGGQAALIPSVPVKVVDAVGAGNAYCGAFLTGWVETHDLVEAGLRGAAAASLIIEHFGTPVVTDELRREAAARVRLLRSGVRRLGGSP